MADILTADLYPAVRAALDVSLDAATLPDATIGLPIYAGQADLWAKAADPAWAADLADPARAVRLQNAAVYYCAALLATAVPVLSREELGQNDYAYTRHVVDPADLAALLRGRAVAEIGALTGDLSAAMPFFFGVAPGRSRWAACARQTLPPGTIVAGA